jgi:hypothetical protein
MMRWQYMAVYGRGEQEKERTTEKTKERVCAIDVIIYKGSWYQMRLAVIDALNNATELTWQEH